MDTANKIKSSTPRIDASKVDQSLRPIVVITNAVIDQVQQMEDDLNEDKKQLNDIDAQLKVKVDLKLVEKLASRIAELEKKENSDFQTLMKQIEIMT